MFFIIVLTWHGLQRALKALLFWFCVHFIGKGCKWHYNEHGLLTSISKQIVIIGEGPSRIVVISSVHALSFSNMLLMIVRAGGGWGAQLFPLLFLVPLGEGFYFLA
jgi:hypothetical protein